MQTSIQKWGDGYAILLSNALLDDARLAVNDCVDITVNGERIIVQKAGMRKKRLEVLLEAYEGDHHLREYD